MSHPHSVICAQLQHACIVNFQNYNAIYMFMSNLIFAGFRVKYANAIFYQSQSYTNGAQKY